MNELGLLVFHGVVRCPCAVCAVGLEVASVVVVAMGRVRRAARGRVRQENAIADPTPSAIIALLFPRTRRLRPSPGPQSVDLALPGARPRRAHPPPRCPCPAHCSHRRTWTRGVSSAAHNAASHTHRLCPVPDSCARPGRPWTQAPGSPNSPSPRARRGHWDLDWPPSQSVYQCEPGRAACRPHSPDTHTHTQDPSCPLGLGWRWRQGSCAGSAHHPHPPIGLQSDGTTKMEIQTQYPLHIQDIPRIPSLCLIFWLCRESQRCAH